MTPKDHGYVKCARCGTWRKREDVDFEIYDQLSGELDIFACIDTAWCSQQAAVGKGEMDGAS